jgi:hypothetical protein
MGNRKDGKKDNSAKSGAARLRQEEKRERALERQMAYDALSVEEKLALIASRPGESKREKERLVTT